MVDNQVCQKYEELIRRDRKWGSIFKTLLSQQNITRANVVDSCPYLLHKSRWQFRIPDHLNMKHKQTKEFLINATDVNTGHAGLYESYIELSEKYHRQNTYRDSQEFLEPCKVCLRTKSSTQKPVGLLTALNVATRPWI